MPRRRNVPPMQTHKSRAFRVGQIEALIWAGFTTSRAIAKHLGINEATVRCHWKFIRKEQPTVRMSA